MGDTKRYMSVGFGDYNSGREYGVWDMRYWGKPVQCTALDTNTSIMWLHYDYDTNIAFITNKGASYISIFYMNESDKSGKPTMYALDKYQRKDRATLT